MWRVTGLSAMLPRVPGRTACPVGQVVYPLLYLVAWRRLVVDQKGLQVSTLADFMEKSGAIGVMRHKGGPYRTCPQHVVSPRQLPSGKPHSIVVYAPLWTHSANRENDMFGHAAHLFGITRFTGPRFLFRSRGESIRPIRGPLHLFLWFFVFPMWCLLLGPVVP